MRTIAAGAIAALALSTAVVAQDAAAPATETAAAAPTAEATPATEAAPVALTPAAPPPECELHVFPTLEGQAMTTGWLSGFGIVGAVADAAGNKKRNIGDAEYLREALGPQMQVDALNTINLVEALNLPPSQIIYEPTFPKWPAA